MMAKDTVYNTMGFFLARSYLTLPQAGSKSGIYCLQEKEGRRIHRRIPHRFRFVIGIHNKPTVYQIFRLTIGNPGRKMNGIPDFPGPEQFGFIRSNRIYLYFR